MNDVLDPEITQFKRIYQSDRRFSTPQSLLLTGLVLLSAGLLLVTSDLAVFAGCLFGLASPLHLHSREASVELMHLVLICWLMVDGQVQGLVLALGLVVCMLARLDFEEGKDGWVELPMRVANANFPCFV
jgi:hypothetical protein